ncbi:hypothetical protein FIBSPDRAFT_1053510 [Athelia psychrophila]|uniref:DUF6593 domain-containing protein n=1 Tax=Athelia psychrophila TaxID=1759441 RepID=A0A167WU95_9AGAM|nr:hypothetical protein FIBSPDRAFT_1053510 [Fibularhizoctonia sp. CBS 109695]
MAPLILTLDSDCPWNTAFVDPEGYVLYETKTHFQGDTNYTAVRDDKEELIGTLRWREPLPDEIMLPGAKGFKSIIWWLKKSMIPMNYDVKLKDDAGRAYVWRGNAPGLTLQLFAAEDKTTPIATYHKSYLISNAPPNPDPAAPRPLLTRETTTRVLATLELTDRAQEQGLRDLVILSFVVLEKGQRTEYRSAAAMQGGMQGGGGFS